MSRTIVFRKRDPRFADYEKYKDQARKDWAKGKPKLFRTDDFIFGKDMRYCICPAGKRLYRSGANERAHRFKGPQAACIPCKLRAKCLRNPDRTDIRQVAYFASRTGQGPTFSDRMKCKIDTTLGLDRFTLLGKTKVNTQWNLFCIVHNLTKIHQYGLGWGMPDRLPPRLRPDKSLVPAPLKRE